MSDNTPAEPVFDLESVYDSEIYPLMDQIIAVCKKHGMPVFASFCYARDREVDGGETKFCTTNLPSSSNWLPPEFIECRQIIYGGASSRVKVAAFTIITP